MKTFHIDAPCAPTPFGLTGRPSTKAHCPCRINAHVGTPPAEDVLQIYSGPTLRAHSVGPASMQRLPDGPLESALPCVPHSTAVATPPGCEPGCPAAAAAPSSWGPEKPPASPRACGDIPRARDSRRRGPVQEGARRRPGPTHWKGKPRRLDAETAPTTARRPKRRRDPERVHAADTEAKCRA